jgi:hypothetical protein
MKFPTHLIVQLLEAAGYRGAYGDLVNASVRLSISANEVKELARD